MTREEFIEILKVKGYPYKIERDKIVITYGWSVVLANLKSLPPGVEFKNGGSVILGLLETLPPSVEFKNGGHVNLSGLETLPPGVAFENDLDVKIKGLGWVNDNEEIGIEGVGNKRLVHLMISKGLFI